MSRLIRAIGLAALGAVAAVATAAAQAPEIARYTGGEDVTARLEQGEIVEREDVRFGDVFAGPPLEDAESSLVMFVVEAPESAAWSVFTGYESQPEFMPHMTSVEVTRGSSETRVCFVYDILWIESTNCFLIEARRSEGMLVGRLDPQRSDDRLHGARYFWHVRPWRSDDRLLLAYYQQISYSGVFTAIGHDAFVGPTRTAEAVRERVREIAGEAPTQPAAFPAARLEKIRFISSTLAR